MRSTLAAAALAAIATFDVVVAQQTIKPYLWQAGMARSEVGEINVFRRFPAELRAKVEDFYAGVLALPVLPATVPGGGQMIRYPVGASEVKLFPTAGAAPNAAGAADVAGVRLLTLFFADEAALTKRFVDRGLMAPRFQPSTAHRGATRAALVQDPASKAALCAGLGPDSSRSLPCSRRSGSCHPRGRRSRISTR